MHTIFNRTFNFFLAICLGFSALAITPAQPARADDSIARQELTSPADHLNPDGTLNLNENFSGSLDLEGWDVAIDPQLGPVFSQAALPKGDWGIMGEGNGPIQNEVHAIAVDGAIIYIGGSFLDVNNNYAADRIVKWNGSSWSALGDNGAGDGSINNGQVNAIAVDTFDGGIYVGGSFTNVNNQGTSLFAADYIAHWDGTNWSALGVNPLFDGALNNTVNAIILNWDMVIAGGAFTIASNFGGAEPATKYIAQFDKASATWSAMGTIPLNNVVRALDWGFTGMYAGGDFTNAGGVAEADYIAKFNFGTSTWGALGNNAAGNGSLNGAVYAIEVYNLSGDNVYVGGSFTAVYNGSITPLPNAAYLTYWNDNDSIWNAVGKTPAQINAAVRSIDMTGGTLMIGGDFTNAGGIAEADYVAQVDVGNWSALGSDGAGNGAIHNSVFALAKIGSAFNVYIGGAFDVVQNGGTTLYQNNYFSLWQNGTWVANTPRNGSLTSKVNSVAVNGTDVYVGGEFTNLSNNGVINLAADYIAKWNGTNWSNLGSNFLGFNGSLNGAVNSIAVSGNTIYVGGSFTDVNNNGSILTAADYIAKWNGTNWSALGATAALTAPVNALVVKSNFVYVGGNFLNAAGINAADYVAKFDTIFNGWSALGNNGLPANGSLNSTVYALALQGNYLYAGGAFTNVNSNGLLLPQADYIARWDLTNLEWLPVGSGLSPALSNTVYALLPSKLNTTDVYVGGSFVNVMDNFIVIPQADYIAKWNGSNWSAIGDDGAGNGVLTGTVRAIAMFGNQIFAGGTFINAKSAAGDYILEWDGAGWKTLSSAFLGNGSLFGTAPFTGVYALAVSNNLYVGGEFYNISDGLNFLSQADYIASYGVDNTPPTVISIVRADLSPTIASSVDYIVTFSEHITGIDTADFHLTTTGSVSGATVSGVSNNAGSVYTVTVNTGIGPGTLRLDVADNNSIIDEAFNPLGGVDVGDGNFTSGEIYTIIKPSPLAATSKWTGDFSYAQGWRTDLHPRTNGDVNGDGKDDLVGFGYGGIFVSLSNGTQFLPVSKWSGDYSYDQGWRIELHPRMVGDVNGDGKDDVVGYGTGGAWVALSDGSKFLTVTKWTSDFSYAQGWRTDLHPRAVGDMNGDGKDDLIGFGYGGIFVALSDGTKFLPVVKWSGDYSYDQGWRIELHPRMVGDVNGDGKDDVVGYGTGGVWVALSDGSKFLAVSSWTSDFSYAQGWRTDLHPRVVGDMNGDGKDDLVGFGYGGVFVSLSDGAKFLPVAKWSGDYSYDQGWRIGLHPRLVGDVNGDLKDDVVGYGTGGVWISVAQ